MLAIPLERWSSSTTIEPSITAEPQPFAYQPKDSDGQAAGLQNLANPAGGLQMERSTAIRLFPEDSHLRIRWSLKSRPPMERVSLLPRDSSISSFASVFTMLH